MRILYTVQRYGEEILGGSETACRRFAENLVRVGHEVEVITSCAIDYRTWKNQLDPGTSKINGVTVHRLPVITPRTEAEFAPLQRRTFFGPRPIPLDVQQQWASTMGPRLQGYEEWLIENSIRFDVAILMTYLYHTTTAGLLVLHNRLPIVLQPTAHNESEIWLTLFDYLFRIPDGFLFLTPEEKDFVQKRFGMSDIGAVVGIGFDPPEVTDESDLIGHFGLEPFKYLIYVGRNDPAKGVPQLVDYFKRYTSSSQSDLKLVILGETSNDVDPNGPIVYPGFVTDGVKNYFIKNSLALIQPSYFESFSIVLCEAWEQGRPVLVQAKNDVLMGQAARAQGGLSYATFEQFQVAVDYLLANPKDAMAMGRWGQNYVRDNYSWRKVITSTEKALESAVLGYPTRKTSASS